MPGFVLQVAPVPADRPPPTVRVGFTVSRKVGNAVARNRVRRRLREIAGMVIPGTARSDLDYVLVGRQPALPPAFPAIGRERRRGRGGPRGPSRWAASQLPRRAPCRPPDPGA